MEKIEHPKVFISYAWKDEDYKNKVLKLACFLKSDGVNVLLDQWSLRPGQDIYAFMEKSVTDPSVTNVLILLDPIYSKKANERSGGVGSETQIISAEVYKKADQAKFIPIIFERNEDGIDPLPAYLKSRNYIDLCDFEDGDENYQKLVRHLYGQPEIVEPELGTKPLWVDNPKDTNELFKRKYASLKKEGSDLLRENKFKEYLAEVKEKFIQSISDDSSKELESDQILSLYQQTQLIRDQFLELLQYVHIVPGSEKLITKTYEEIFNVLNPLSTIKSELLKTRLHELFIYTIAIYHKEERFKELSNIFSKTYSINTIYMTQQNKSFCIFYHDNSKLEEAIKQRDQQNYFSGIAYDWVQTLNKRICTQDQFVLADALCYQASVFQNGIDKSKPWIPITCSYDKYYQIMKTFSQRLSSKEHLKEIAQIFGYKREEEFIHKLEQIKQYFNEHPRERIRWPMRDITAPLIFDYIDSNQLGSCN